VVVLLALKSLLGRTPPPLRRRGRPARPLDGDHPWSTTTRSWSWSTVAVALFAGSSERLRLMHLLSIAVASEAFCW